MIDENIQNELGLKLDEYKRMYLTDQQAQALTLGEDNLEYRDLEDKKESYKYTVGEDIDPGVYKLNTIFVNNEEERGWDDSVVIEVANEDMDIDTTLPNTSDTFVNLDLKVGDEFSIRQSSDEPIVNFLSVQEEDVKFQEDEPEKGVYKPGKTIEKGEYTVADDYSIKICQKSEEKMRWFDCENYYEGDVFEVDNDDSFIIVEHF